MLACSSAVREWDANGTNFGYNPARGATAGEFGHNDFYPVAVAAAQLAGWDGRQTLVAMATLDEIRGRLAEVFALKNHKIDHVLHGAIASAAVYGAVLGATAEQIESAIGLVVAHYVPFRAIRDGHQLSDSKGASAAISAEVAVLSMRRAMRDSSARPTSSAIRRRSSACSSRREIGVGDSRLASPFDLALATAGDDFAVMGMHFKLGLYEHQSAGAIQGVIDLVATEPKLLDDPDQLRRHADSHLRAGVQHHRRPAQARPADAAKCRSLDAVHRGDAAAQGVRSAAKRVGRPRRLATADARAGRLCRGRVGTVPSAHAAADGADRFPSRRPGVRSQVSGRHSHHGRNRARQAWPALQRPVMYPEGHARNTTCDLTALLEHKFRLLAGLGVDDTSALVEPVHESSE